MQRRIDDLVAYATALIDLYLQTHQNFEILESLGTTDIVDRLHHSYGARAFDALVNALIQDIIRNTWALALDKAEATPSIVNIWRLVNHADVLPTLRARFVSAKSPDIAHNQNPGDARSRSRQFDEAAVRLAKSVPAVSTGSQAKKFARARNKGVAHLEMQRSPEGGSRPFDLRSSEIGWDGFREYVEWLAPVVEDLAMIITGTKYRLADVHEHHRINVWDFWMRMMGTGSITPQ